ncbi:MAG: tRNA (N(6)-L-threonylcarbamoyladenosine(37)-C(2))-methylthiotransferase MtaB [Holosporales bacterium]|jgi:threonylcarbamoyladenosine tRNA methylthiotransferase MtaB|nr:tRNA (N(6)-L-threonylcarbamoyladenosine(37)-C(2))-methylthiotransferase MtaB [Holosporales bacterium]
MLSHKLGTFVDVGQKKVKTITLGCRFNSYESEVSKALIETLVPETNVILINTCAVTHEAERQSKQAVRRAIRENKEAVIIVTGCAAKTSQKYFEDLDGVFKVIQNDKKTDINEYKFVSLNPNLELKEPSLFENRVRAFLQIQNGCDHFCTYCIVPFTRGRSKSLPIAEILKRVGYFESHGFKEIVLSGIDIASYGKDMKDEYRLVDVIKSIFKKYPKQERIRISSIDPKEISGPLLDLFIHDERIMPHFHLSIQSGDNETLKLMRRRHTREDVLKLCQELRMGRKNVVIGADLLAGLPFENDKMFENTLSLIDDAELSLIHSFTYSPRQGTVAAQMIQLPRKVIIERGQILCQKAKKAKLKMFKSMVGQNVSGIVEKYQSGIAYGKTDSFITFQIKKQISPNTVINNAKVIGFCEECILLAN